MITFADGAEIENVSCDRCSKIHVNKSDTICTVRDHTNYNEDFMDMEFIFNLNYQDNFKLTLQIKLTPKIKRD